MKFLKTIILLTSWPSLILLGQDTTFVNKHSFSTPIRNVFETGNDIYVKTGDGLYKLENNKWLLQKMKFEKTFVFYDKGFFEADYIPNVYIFDARPMADLIPQGSLSNGTMARINDQLFVSVGGSLFEYSINRYYRHFYNDCSIRDIFMEKGLKVVSTYSGIFINDSIKATSPTYSNGCFSKVQGKYYLSSDSLFLFKSPSKFENIESGTNLFAGYSRKLSEFQNKIYSLNTKSVNQFDSSFGLKPIHQGYEYFDMETVDNLLLFCTGTGEVFQFDGQKSQLLLKINTRIRDIYSYNKTVYFSTDLGVYTLQNLQTNTLKLVANLKFSVKVIIDFYNNTWISTENGLYVLPDKKTNPIEFIKDVEFNRGALTVYGDEIYAGSINGLYVINIYSVVKNFLPLYLNKKGLVEKERKKTDLIIFSIIILLTVLTGYYFYKRNKKTAISITDQKEEPALTLKKIGEDIRIHNIMTVEALAEYYKTNTVQLNRQFKTFDTTPGKFMKKIKLSLASELLKNGVPMEEVVAKTGYSVGYLKKELNI